MKTTSTNVKLKSFLFDMESMKAGWDQNTIIGEIGVMLVNHHAWLDWYKTGYLADDDTPRVLSIRVKNGCEADRKMVEAAADKWLRESFMTNDNTPDEVDVRVVLVN